MMELIFLFLDMDTLKLKVQSDYPFKNNLTPGAHARVRVRWHSTRGKEGNCMASLAAVRMVKDPLTLMESRDNISDCDTAATATRTSDA